MGGQQNPTQPPTSQLIASVEGFLPAIFPKEAEAEVAMKAAVEITWKAWRVWDRCLCSHFLELSSEKKGFVVGWVFIFWMTNYPVI